MAVEPDGRDSGEPVVRMRQFRLEDRLDQIVRRGELADDLVEDLTLRVAGLHSSAAPAGVEMAKSFPERLGAAIRDNFARMPATQRLQELHEAFESKLEQCGPLLEVRARQGSVRECHGDLHLANICLWRGTPRLFDALEFNESLRWIDVLSDAAFLFMDLSTRTPRAPRTFFSRVTSRRPAITPACRRGRSSWRTARTCAPRWRT
jgi:aminoglycoside phosphotransferase family enzyme